MKTKQSQSGRRSIRGDGQPPGVVVSLDDERALDPDLVGNKAARLARLRQEGFRVPPGAALVADWCEAVSPGDEDVQTVADAAIDAVGAGPYAVRSSGVAEDGDEEAMAGRYHTELNVASDDVATAIERCIEGAAAVDRAEGRAHQPVAILVQRMVEADFAGVAFTRNPVTGDAETVIDAVAGLADELVGGEATGERWVVDDGQPIGLDNENVLEPRKAAEIAATVARVESAWDGVPQDVEWAWDDDELYLVQTRPITALPVPPPEQDIPDGTWVQDHSHYPNGVTPLCASVYVPAIEDASEYAFGLWGLMVEKAEQIIYRHRPYVRPVPVGGAKDGAPPPAIVMGALIRLIPALRKRAKRAKEALSSGLGDQLVEQWEQEHKPWLADETKRMRDSDLGQLSDEELAEHFDACVELLREGQRIHFALFIPYVTPLYDLSRFTEEHLGWDVNQTLELLAGLSEETSGPGRELHELARTIADAGVAEVLRDLEVADEDLAGALSEAHDAAGEAWREFVDRWGYRVMGYDPGDPTLAERPGLIRHRVLEVAERGREREAALRERRENAEEEARGELPSASLRQRFDELVEAARRAWPNREENVAYTDSMTNATVRYAGLEIGRRLVERGLLDDAEDMAMLSREELFEALLEGSDMRAVARRRHAERAWVAAHPPPPVLGGEEHPPPDLKWAPTAVQRTSGALMWIFDTEYSETSASDSADEFVGVPAAPGRTTGTVRIVNGPDDFDRVRAGDVMVCPTTTPAWTIVFPTIAGIVAEGGGALAHAGIAAREHHIPAVLGISGARAKLTEGATVEIDGTEGTVRVLS